MNSDGDEPGVPQDELELAEALAEVYAELDEEVFEHFKECDECDFDFDLIVNEIIDDALSRASED